jgi:hypothetical protein
MEIFTELSCNVCLFLIFSLRYANNGITQSSFNNTSTSIYADSKLRYCLVVIVSINIRYCLVFLFFDFHQSIVRSSHEDSSECRVDKGCTERDRFYIHLVIAINYRLKYLSKIAFLFSSLLVLRCLTTMVWFHRSLFLSFVLF